jgi:hypothetical protein
MPTEAAYSTIRQLKNDLTQTEIIDNYIFSVPHVEDDEKIFLKTIIPNGKATKKYLGSKK